MQQHLQEVASLAACAVILTFILTPESSKRRAGILLAMLVLSMSGSHLGGMTGLIVSLGALLISLAICIELLRLDRRRKKAGHKRVFRRPQLR